jgi:hypothetical protein
MKRLLAIAATLHLAHLGEEAAGAMHDDPIVTAAYAVFAPLGARHAAYLLFQITYALGLVAVVLVARGGPARRAVFALYGVALLAEAHHPLRALVAFAPNPGLVTSLPLPLLGALVLVRALSPRRKTACLLTSSSPWESAASCSASRRSSLPAPALASSASPSSTTTRPHA